MKVKYTPLFLGLAHGLTDASTAFILLSQPQLSQTLELYIFYNLIAFALQPLLGAFVDQQARFKWALVGSLSMVACGVILAPLNLWSAIFLAAIGSALFHVTGGALSAMINPKKSAHSSLFVAPGVVGLTLGSLGALAGLELHFFLCLSLMTISFFCLSIPILQLPHIELKPFTTNHRDNLTILLLLAVAMRSFLWVSIATQSQATLLLAVGLGAGLGKLTGGFIADRVGYSKTTTIGLMLAVAIMFSGQQDALFLAVMAAGIQLSSPMTLSSFVGLYSNQPATAAGLALGFALALGGVPHLIGLDLSFLTATIGLLLIVLFWWTFTQVEQHLEIVHD